MSQQRTQHGAKPRVVVVMTPTNGLAYVLADADVEVIEINPERAEDRVYRLTEGLALVIDRRAVDAMLDGETVGHSQDGRHDLLLATPSQRALA